MENTKEYRLKNVTYKWIKSQIKLVNRIETTNGNRLKTLVANKNKLRLSEFQPLYEYWLLCDYYDGTDFKIANNPIYRYKVSGIVDFIWYATMLQLFTDVMKDPRKYNKGIYERDLYTNPYTELLTLPKLSGDLNSDLIIFEGVIRNIIYAPNGSIRQCIILYDIHLNRLF